MNLGHKWDCQADVLCNDASTTHCIPRQYWLRSSLLEKDCVYQYCEVSEAISASFTGLKGLSSQGGCPLTINAPVLDSVNNQMLGRISVVKVKTAGIEVPRAANLQKVLPFTGAEPHRCWWGYVWIEGMPTWD